MPLSVLRGAFLEGNSQVLDHVRICCSHGVPYPVLIAVSSDDFNRFVNDVKIAACSTDGREFSSYEPICFTTDAETCFLITADRLLHNDADVRVQKDSVASIIPQGFKPDSFMIVCITPRAKQVEPTLEFIIYPDDSEAQRTKNPAYHPVHAELYDEFTVLRPVREYISRLVNTACARAVKLRASLGVDDGDSSIFSARGRAN